MNNSPLLRVENVKKYFETPGGQLQAVDGVSFSVNEGETLGVVGESGCGKSTLGRTILLLHKATSGSIYFEGEDILHYGPKEIKNLRQKMQIVFQDPYSSLNPRMSVSQIITEPLLLHGVVGRRSSAELNKKVESLMDTVGLAKRFVNAYPHELDGGRRQRIGIARALALNPKFIVCDEPVSALDVSIQAQVLNLMQDLQEEFKLTYMFITHDLSVVKHISNEIIVMYLGKIVERAKPDDLFTNPRHPYTRALLSAIPVADPDIRQSVEILQGEVSSPINMGGGCRFAKRCRYAKPECSGTNIPEKEVESGHFVSCIL